MIDKMLIILEKPWPIMELSGHYSIAFFLLFLYHSASHPEKALTFCGAE